MFSPFKIYSNKPSPSINNSFVFKNQYYFYFTLVCIFIYILHCKGLSKYIIILVFDLSNQRNNLSTCLKVTLLLTILFSLLTILQSLDDFSHGFLLVNQGKLLKACWSLKILFVICDETLKK